jgi:hypothetical protein
MFIYRSTGMEDKSMSNLKIFTGLIAMLVALGLCGAATADPRGKAGEAQFAVTAPFVDIGGVADCEDDDADDVCDKSIAFITKTGHWGIRISGVESNGVGPFRVCLTVENGALLVAEGLIPVGPNGVISAGGGVYADTGLEVVQLPGFAVMRDDELTGCWGHLVEFVTGVRVY